MENLSVINNLPKRIAVIYKDLRNVLSKLHRSAGSIGFIKKALFNEVTPNFAQDRGNFISKIDKCKSERSIFLSHLNDHVIQLKILGSTQHQLIDKLRHLTGRLLYRLIVNYINAIQYNELISSFKTKNNKLKRLIQAKSPRSNFKVPIGNLSLDKLSVKERKQLEMELEFSFFDKNKHLNKQVAANFKTLLHRASDSVLY